MHSEDLMKVLSHYGIVKDGFFALSALENGILEIRRQYLAQGKYECMVRFDVIDLPKNNSVFVRITLSEGIASEITMINIVGNNLFGESELLNNFRSKYDNGGLLLRLRSIIKANINNYSRQILSNDLKKLSSFYLDKGYHDFTVESTQISLSRDHKQIFITINIFL